MIYYAVTAIAVRTEVDSDGKESHRTQQVPTFYLHKNVQGIVDQAHAMEIARRVVNPLSDPAVEVSVYAEEVRNG